MASPAATSTCGFGQRASHGQVLKSVASDCLFGVLTVLLQSLPAIDYEKGRSDAGRCGLDIFGLWNLETHVEVAALWKVMLHFSHWKIHDVRNLWGRCS